jgi:NAD kinase
MEGIAVIGFSLGTLGFIYALAAKKRIDKLIKHLKENDIIDEGYSDSK